MNQPLAHSSALALQRGGHRTGAATSIVMIILVALGLIGTGGYFIYSMSSKAAAKFDPITAFAERGDFIAQVLDQGEIQSSENVEIRCRARARNGDLKVIEVVPEGTSVKAGDFLVRLDATGFETELEQQKVQVTTAQTAKIQSEATLAAAIASKKEYLEGLFVESQRTIQNEIFEAKAAIETAKQEKVQSEAVLEHSVKLQSKGFITRQRLTADEFAVERAKFNLEKADNSLLLAEKKLEVLEKITREKELVRLDSEIASADIKSKNDAEALKVEEQKLKEIQQQIANCVITVPPGVEGQVVYAQESSRGGTEWVLEEGTAVRENQVLLRLPNPAKMEVKALINEQSITLIRPEMPATIKVDALNSQTLRGVVTRVNQYAEQSGWFSTSVRKYAVLVRILNPPDSLKPGMNASVTVQTRFEKDVLTVPLQCVFGVQDRFFCLARRGQSGWETRELKTDGDNSQVVVIKEGLEPGDEVVMNPGAYRDIMDLPEIEAEKPLEVPAGEAAALVREAAAEAQQQGGESSGGPPGGGGGPPGGFDIAGMANQGFSSADTDSDGKLSASEMESLDERMRGMFGRADANSDGEISRAELDASIKRIQERMQGGGPGGPGGERGEGRRGGEGRGGEGGERRDNGPRSGDDSGAQPAPGGNAS